MEVEREWEDAAAAIVEAAQETARGVKAGRESLRYSQGELAERMRRLGHNWHQTTVGKVESGSRPIKWDEALALAYVLGHDNLNSLLSGHLSGQHLKYEMILAEHSLELLRDYAERVQEAEARLEQLTSVVSTTRRVVWRRTEAADGEHPEAP